MDQMTILQVNRLTAISYRIAVGPQQGRNKAAILAKRKLFVVCTNCYIE